MTSLDGLNPDFRDMVAMLCDEGAEFLVVGAYAVSFHGHARTTGDMDLLVRPTAANAARVWRALVRFGARLQPRAWSKPTSPSQTRSTRSASRRGGSTS
jgi:hypothetical protein